MFTAENIIRLQKQRYVNRRDICYTDDYALNTRICVGKEKKKKGNNKEFVMFMIIMIIRLIYI